MLDDQVAVPFAGQFRPRTTSNVVRTFLRKSVTRRPTHGQKKWEPGGWQFRLL